MIWILFSLFIRHIDQDEYVDEINDGDGKTPFFVMFSGETCPACRMAYPEFERAAKLTHGAADFVVLDTRKNPQLAMQLGIYSIPQFVLFFNKSNKAYNNYRTSSAFKKFVYESLVDQVPVIDADNDDWKDKDMTVILFSKRRKAPAIIAAAMGKFYRSGINFYVTSEKTVADEFDPEMKLPQIYFATREAKKLYDGPQQIQDLNKAIEEFFDVLPAQEL